MVACLALAAVVALASTAAARVRADRRVEAHVRAVADRLDPAPPGGAAGGLPAALARLDRAAAAATARAAGADEARRSLAAALEALPLGVVVAAADGEVVFRNAASDDLLGPTAADAVAELLAGASAGQPAEKTLELFGPPRRTLSLTATPLPGGAAAVVVDDVSDRLRLDAVRRDFVANVSHELKTPVAALGLLAETLAGEDDVAVVHRLAGRMQDDAFRVARVIDDLLDLSRLESEEAARHEPVRVADVVAQAADHVRAAADARGVRLECSGVPRSLAVPGERRQLVSALANLLDNAVKYSPGGATVEVTAATDGSAVEVTVRDAGIGIPARDLDRIFERFYRVDRGRGRDTGGTGLGLSIVRHVASNHGGDVLVESVEGEGSAFTLRLPASAGPVGLVAEAG